MKGRRKECSIDRLVNKYISSWTFFFMFKERQEDKSKAKEILIVLSLESAVQFRESNGKREREVKNIILLVVQGMPISIFILLSAMISSSV